MLPATKTKASEKSGAFLFTYLSDSLYGHRLQTCAIVVYISERSGCFFILNLKSHRDKKRKRRPAGRLFFYSIIIIPYSFSVR